MKVWIKLMNFGKRLGCHQMAERSFFLKGYQFPICARCTGVLIGEISAIICIFFVKIKWIYSILLLVPMGIDWGIQYLKICESTNIRRLVTGLLGGFGLTYIYYLLFVLVIKQISSLF